MIQGFERPRGFDPKARLVPLAADDRRRLLHSCGASRNCRDDVVAQATYRVDGLRNRREVFYFQRHGEAFAHRHKLEVTW